MLPDGLQGTAEHFSQTAGTSGKITLTNATKRRNRVRNNIENTQVIVGKSASGTGEGHGED